MADPTVETVNPLETNENSTDTGIETVAEKADRLIAEHDIREPLHDATYTLVEHGNFDLEQLNDTDMITTLEAFDRFQDWAQSGPLGMEQGTILSEAVARATVEPELMDDFIDDLLDDNTFNDPTMLERLFSDDTQLTQFITSQLAAAGAGGNFQNAFSHNDDDSTRLSGGRRKGSGANSALETASTMGLLNSGDIQGMLDRIGEIDRRREEIAAEKEVVSAQISANEAEILHLQTSVLTEIDLQIAQEEARIAAIDARLAEIDTEIEDLIETIGPEAMEAVNADLSKFATIDVDTDNDGIDHFRIVYQNEEGEYYILAEGTNEPILVDDLPDSESHLARIQRQIEENNLITGDQDPQDAADFNRNLDIMYGAYVTSPLYQERQDLMVERLISSDRLETLKTNKAEADARIIELTQENTTLQARLEALDAEDASLAEERTLLETQIASTQALSANLAEQSAIQGRIINLTAEIQDLPAPSVNDEAAQEEWQANIDRLTAEIEAEKENLQRLEALQFEQETLEETLANLQEQKDEATTARNELLNEYEAMANAIEDPELRAVALERLETGQVSCALPYISMVDAEDPRFNDADRAYITHAQDIFASIDGKPAPSTEGLSDELRNILRMDEIGQQFEQGGWAVAEQDRKIDNISDEISDAKIRLANLNAETNERVSADNAENLTLEGPAPGEMEREETLRNQAMNYAAEIAANPYVVEADLEGYFGELSEDELDLVINVLEDKGIEVDRHEADEPAPEEELVADAGSIEPSRDGLDHNQTASVPTLG